MPVMKCQRDQKQGRKWGEQGYCYIPGEDGCEDILDCEAKARTQGKAVESGQTDEDEESED